MSDHLDHWIRFSHSAPCPICGKPDDCVDMVGQYIATGQLRAVDFSLRPGGKRPRWKIPLTAIEKFEAARSSKAPANKQPRRRRTKTATTRREWF